MTPQEMFNKAYLGILDQGKQSRDGNFCKYRGPNGLKCAVGHLIDDDIALAWDKRTFSSIMEIRETKRFPIPEHIRENRVFLRQMQVAHDNTHSMKDFKVEMRKVASQYGLEIPKHV